MPKLRFFVDFQTEKILVSTRHFNRKLESDMSLERNKHVVKFGLLVITRNVLIIVV